MTLSYLGWKVRTPWWPWTALYTASQPTSGKRRQGSHLHFSQAGSGSRSRWFRSGSRFFDLEPSGKTIELVSAFLGGQSLNLFFKVKCCVQCCGWGILLPDSGKGRKKYPGSASASKNLGFYWPKNWVINSRKYNLGCSSRIRIFLLGPKKLRIRLCFRIRSDLPQFVWSRNRFFYFN